jgi:Mg2+ and Co2+ transporter CorA
MTISAHIIDKQKIKQIDDFLSVVASLKKEMAEQAASLWVHIDDLADVFRLQDIFGLQPLAIDAVIHQNHPSKVEEYDTYTCLQLLTVYGLKRKGDLPKMTFTYFLGSDGSLLLIFTTVSSQIICERKFGAFYLRRKSKHYLLKQYARQYTVLQWKR